ncbi:MAG: hypothetical protein FJ167_13750 [Gammaproteobacteria bacterium]|nr:hypothetical protein [Gammaproteobacteria bacterium]
MQEKGSEVVVDAHLFFSKQHGKAGALVRVRYESTSSNSKITSAHILRNFDHIADPLHEVVFVACLAQACDEKPQMFIYNR